MAKRGGATHDCLAVCAPGLEPFTSAELEALGLRPGRPVHGGVPFRARTRQLYLTEIWLRTATRILVRMGSFTARTFGDLEVGAARLDWDSVLPIGAPATFRVTSHRSKLYHTGAVAERLVQMTGAATADVDASPEAPQVHFVVRIVDDRVEISADATGVPLHRRGWRRATAKAPLRETLAAALIMAGGWKAEVPLVDPLCGSGTIAIEAATIARRLAPGRHRPHALAAWPSFQPGTWASVTGEADAGELPPGSGPPIFARDRDAGAIESARSNAARARVAEDVEGDVAPLSRLGEVLSGGGHVVTNPPWGARIDHGGDLRDLYAALGSVVSSAPAPTQLTMLVADERLAAHTGLQLREAFRTTSGGTPVRALTTTAPVTQP